MLGYYNDKEGSSDYYPCQFSTNPGAASCEGDLISFLYDLYKYLRSIARYDWNVLFSVSWCWCWIIFPFVSVHGGLSHCWNGLYFNGFNCQITPAGKLFWFILFRSLMFCIRNLRLLFLFYLVLHGIDDYFKGYYSPPDSQLSYICPYYYYSVAGSTICHHYLDGKILIICMFSLSIFIENVVALVKMQCLRSRISP